MRNKQMKSASTSIIILWSVVIATGCSHPWLHHRPSHSVCKQWLSGQTILIKERVLFDETWTIHADQFKEFSILSISKNSEGTYTAKVKFDLNSNGRGLRVEGTIQYRAEKKDRLIQFVGFTPERLIKLGKW
jgi:hypothetical protein